MTAFTGLLINAITLIAMSLWAYFGSETPSPTAFIPAVFGVIFLICGPGMKKHNKIVAHIVVFLTFLLILALAMPLKAAIGRGDTLAIIRVAIMLGTTLLAFVLYIKSFRDARRARKS